MTTSIFARRSPTTLFGAAFTTLALIYHMTVHNLRQTHRDPVIGLLMTVVQSLTMIAGFLLIFVILGVRTSPLRGDFVVYIMTGIFVYMTHVQTVMAVQGSGSATSAMMKHGPINTAVLISSAALAVLYRQTFACIVIVVCYDLMFQPIQLENPLACYAILMLAWFSGLAVGMVFLGLNPWLPTVAPVITRVYVRVNMMASGKMFVANTVPAFMLPMFIWNPLFHLIDQMRGFAFVNYYPRNTDLMYPVWFSIAALMIGLMAEFVTRNKISISWFAGR